MPKRRPTVAAPAWRTPLPAGFKPQLASLVKEPPEGDAWIHEMKYDGYRIGCRLDRGRVALFSRNGKDWTASFPEICDAAGHLRATQALVDGEVAIVMPDGRTSFQALQNAFSGGSRGGLVYFAFDLLHVDGESLAEAPLESRKARLRAVLGKPTAGARIRYSDHVAGNGPAVFREACRLGLEGIVSKRRDRPYRPGPHGGWVKTKCTGRQEFVIGGFTDPEGSREGIGALVLGYYDEERRLVFAGKVGTGFSRQVARDLRSRLERLARPFSPFTDGPTGRLGRHAHWVRPELVAEVAFTEWTEDGKVRHPSFQGLRHDRDATEVSRERSTISERPTATAPAQQRAPRRRTRGSRSGPR